MKVFLKIAISFLILDFFISTLFLKNTTLWNKDQWINKHWRIQSVNYHHDLIPNADVVESWGGKLKRRIITNSLGFRGFKKDNIQKNSNKKRILLVGDSFIEGSGYDYEFTIGGLLQKKLGSKYQILNSAVESYSPSIYYKKTQYFLSKGYKFDQALIFLDVSDIYDELFIQFDDLENIVTDLSKNEINKGFQLKHAVYSLGKFLRDNTVTFRLLNIISDKTEIYKNYLKLKYKTSKIMDKKFFDIDEDDVMFYRMTHIDRGYWTYSDEKYNQVKKGLEQSERYLKKLFELLKENSIESHLIIYPWPTQIEFGDEKHVNFWKEFSTKNNINFVNLYDSFYSRNTRSFIMNNFIYGDIHWNKKGTKLAFDQIIEEIKF